MITFTKDETKIYLERVVGKLYKILPICEKNPDTKNAYIQSLIRELHGSCLTLSNNYDKTSYMSIINTLAYLTTAEFSHAEYRTEVFKCINIIKQMTKDVGVLNEF